MGTVGYGGLDPGLTCASHQKNPSHSSSFGIRLHSSPKSQLRWLWGTCKLNCPHSPGLETIFRASFTSLNLYHDFPIVTYACTTLGLLSSLGLLYNTHSILNTAPWSSQQHASPTYFAATLNKVLHSYLYWLTTQSFFILILLTYWFTNKDLLLAMKCLSLIT